MEIDFAGGENMGVNYYYDGTRARIIIYKWDSKKFHMEWYNFDKHEWVNSPEGVYIFDPCDSRAMLFDEIDENGVKELIKKYPDGRK